MCINALLINRINNRNFKNIIIIIIIISQRAKIVVSLVFALRADKNQISKVS